MRYEAAIVRERLDCPPCRFGARITVIFGGGGIMAYWLLKTEPTVYSYSNLETDKKTVWDGVTNNLALKHIRSMRKGDLAFIYHTGDEKSLIGIAEVASDPYPDPKEKDPRLAVVEIKAKERL